VRPESVTSEDNLGRSSQLGVLKTLMKNISYGLEKILEDQSNAHLTRENTERMNIIFY
jgi:hypothetical protein